MQLTPEMIFSRYGTNWAIGPFDPADKQSPLVLSWVYGGRRSVLMEISGRSNEAATLSLDIRATPTKLILATPNGATAEFCLGPGNMLFCRGAGLALVFSVSPPTPAWSTAVSIGPDRWRFNILDCQFDVRCCRGRAELETHWSAAHRGERRHHRCDPIILQTSADFELAIHGYVGEPDSDHGAATFDARLKETESEWQAWRDSHKAVFDAVDETTARAAYLRWSSVVPPAGHLHTDAMLMSKVRMVNVWNWDNYFNAWASALHRPDFAWRQYDLYFAHQTGGGGLPDAINQQSIGRSFTKPPLHGWVLTKLVAEAGMPDESRLSRLYDGLARSTRWWFTHRDADSDGICEYHHGNDSGWDDSSLFDAGIPLEAPDLNALLILQMEALAWIATRLGRDEEAGYWADRSTKLLDLLIEHAWDGEQFLARVSGSHRPHVGDSLLAYVPVILGRRLPEQIRSALTAGLQMPSRFLTDHGLATESTSSEHFLANGYWRGPIWAPPMIMIIDGLADAGETAFASDLARRFCRLCEQSGFAECFNPLTAEPLHDLAYTWTASVYLILKARYCRLDTSTADHRDCTHGLSNLKELA